jgi:hypothetical protein
MIDMRTARDPALLTACLLVLGLAACGTATNPGADGPASTSPSTVAADPGTGSATPTPNAWVPTSVLPEGDFVLRGIDTDQPCTATQEGGAPVELGISLQEVAAMTVDPGDLEEFTGDVWIHESMFLDNFEFGTGWPEGCQAAEVLGRVTGHMQSLTNYEAAQGEVATPQVLSTVHLFQTAAGAKAYMRWVPEAQPWPCPMCTGMMGGPVSLTEQPVTETLAGAGAGGVLIHMRSEQGARDVALVRDGTVVGEVIVTGPSGRLPEIDIAALAARQATQISTVEPTGEPYDVMQVMSAPLPISAWAEDFGALEWDLNYAGGRDNWEYVQMAMDPTEAAADLKEYQRLVGYQANFSPPPWVATALTLYPDPERARAALEDIVDDRLTGTTGRADPATQWDVDGLPDAIGLTFYTGRAGDRQLVSEVWLLHGSSVNRAYVVAIGNGSVAEEEQHKSTVTTIAQQWAPRLDDVLGSE